jgi:hypothetical protein
MQQTKPLVFLKTGWMARYEGTRGDKLLGGYKHLKEHDGQGAESLNFKTLGGFCYGYAPAKSGASLASWRSHAAPTASHK